jgi:biopolymer transport protein ExbD
MAGGMDLGNGGKGGKKPLDTAINLVPFIDLMAVTISFLIMTAVWTQIGRLQVSQAGGPTDPTEEQEDKKTVPLTLLITDKEVKLTAGGTAYDPMPLVRDANGKLELVKLIEKLKEIKTQIPDQSTITLQTEDSVKYEDLVRIIDECIGSGLPQVSVQAAMG